VSKGVEIEFLPVDDDHARARISWREQDAGGGTLTVEVTVRTGGDHPKSNERLKADALAIAVRFVRAFADTIQG
jgi:hypothetical protein